MRTLLQQAALGLVMSAGTVALCSVPSDTTPNKARPDQPSAGLATCSVSPPPAPIDLTQGPAALNADKRPGATAKGESPGMRRLRQAEDPSTPRRDYFDERAYDDEAPRTPAPRIPRKLARARGPAADVTKLASGLESRDGDDGGAARVQRFVRFFTESREGRDGFLAALERSGKFEELITQALDDRRLPRALIATALVESGFSPTAVSPAGAAGLWQFMPGTAKAYGLRVDRGYDERLSPWRASQAAAEHLADLYEAFQSWELALAAYNMGYNGLVSRLEAHKAKTFWELADIEGGLPAETALYVPRVLAAAKVMANLDAFGFDTLRRSEPVAASEVEAPPGMPVHLLARAAGMPVRAFRELNNELVGSATPRGPEPVLVHVPTGLVERTRATLARLERGEIDPEDLDRPRERTTRDEPAPRRATRSWDRDRDDDRDLEPDLDRAPLPSRYSLGERSAPRWRSLRDVRDARARSTRYDDEPIARFAPYAHESREPRDEDRDPPSRAHATHAAHKAEPSTVFYRTVEGDTALSIGKTFGLPAEDVCTQNGLKLGTSIDKGTLLRLRVSTKSLEKLSPVVASNDG